MIADFFIGLVYTFVSLLTAPFLLLPDVTLRAIFTDSVATASAYVISRNAIVPVDTLLYIFFLFLAYELAYFGVKLINWVIRKIPTIS